MPDTPTTNPLIDFVESLKAQLSAELERVAAYRFTPVPEPDEPIDSGTG